MKNKITEEDIKKECINNKIIFIRLDGRYKNQNEKNIICKCEICNKEYESNFKKIKKGIPVCKDCMKEHLRRKYSCKYEDVKEYIEKYDFILIDTEYKNAHEKLNIKCNLCGECFKVSFNNFKKEKCKCPKCSYVYRANGKRFNEAYIKNFIKENGYELMSKYNNCDEKLHIKCNNNHVFKMNFYDFKNRDRRCPICYNLKNKSGENSPSWKGGITPISNHLRNVINNWKIDSFKKYNYQCCVTNTNKNLIIHHLHSFNSIVRECMDKLSLELKPIGDYTNEEINKIDNLFIELHYKYGLGVCICREVHDKFHSIYGKGNNTKSQWLEFIKKYC